MTIRDQKHVLVVEDNPADVAMLRAAFEDALNGTGLRFELTVLSDGDAACELLEKLPPSVDLVILDVNLPKRTGLEVLEHLHVVGVDVRVPILVMTTSEAPSDVNRSYQLGAAAFVVKPLGVDATFAVVESISRFWLQTVTRPEKSA